MWRENENDIRKLLDGKKKVANITIPKSKKEMNYLKRINLPNARTWFRFRCKLTKHMKGKTSSAFKDNMQC